MGAWCSKENQAVGRQPHNYNHYHNHNNSAATNNSAPTSSGGSKSRFAKIGDDYNTLEQVSRPDSI